MTDQELDRIMRRVLIDSMKLEEDGEDNGYRPVPLPQEHERFVLHYRNEPEGQFLTWNFINFFKMPDHLHKGVLNGVLRRALIP